MFYTNTELSNPLLEAYYGKRKEFIVIEQELDKIIKVIKSNSEIQDGNIKLNKNIKSIAKSDSVVTIEKLFKKVFNLSDFYLCFYTAFPLGIMYRIDFNAFTWGKGFNYFRQKESNKRVDSTDMVIGVNVDMGLIRGLNMSAEELMAIILHEIGHNMSASIFSLFSKISITSIDNVVNGTDVLNSVVGFGISEFIGPLITDVNKQIEDKLEQIPSLKKFFSILSSINVNISMLLQGLGIGFIYIINLIKSPNALITLLNPRNIFGYAEEKYADSFATSYGYGPALSTCLAKMKTMPGVKSMQIIQNVPVLNWSFDFLKISFRIASGIFDEHPQDASRIMSQLQKLKRDLNDPDIDPRIKKDIKKDIDRLETFIDKEYISFCNIDNKRQIFTWLYNLITIKIFKGNIDARELFKVFDVEE